MFQRLRLLFCCFDFVPTASMLSRRITYYIKALSGSFELSLLCIKDTHHPHVERYEKARILRVPLKEGTLQQRIQQFERAIRRQLESEEYAVVHSFDFASGQVLADLKKQLGYQLVFEASMLSSQEWPHRPFELALCENSLAEISAKEAYVASHSDALIVATEQQKNYLHNEGLSHIPIHVLPCPAPPREKIPPHPGGKILAFPSHHFQLLHLGGESQFASLQTTLNAFNTLPPKFKIQLAFGGYYGAKSKAQLTALQKNPHPKGTLLWPTLKQGKELSALCARSHAALLVLEAESRNVNFGSAMPELADFCTWGLPIIASDLPCVREFLGQDEALFFPPGNSTLLAERMQELASSPKLQAHLAAASASKAARFLPSLFIEKLSSLYHQWIDKQFQQSEQFFEILPDITPSMIATDSGFFSSSPAEQDTLVVLPPSTSSPPE